MLDALLSGIGVGLCIAFTVCMGMAIGDWVRRGAGGGRDDD